MECTLNFSFVIRAQTKTYLLFVQDFGEKGFYDVNGDGGNAFYYDVIIHWSKQLKFII
jgi:hypothetical protein